MAWLSNGEFACLCGSFKPQNDLFGITDTVKVMIPVCEGCLNTYIEQQWYLQGEELFKSIENTPTALLCLMGRRKWYLCKLNWLNTWTIVTRVSVYRVCFQSLLDHKKLFIAKSCSLPFMLALGLLVQMLGPHTHARLLQTSAFTPGNGPHLYPFSFFHWPKAAFFVFSQVPHISVSQVHDKAVLNRVFVRVHSHEQADGCHWHQLF